MLSFVSMFPCIVLLSSVVLTVSSSRYAAHAAHRREVRRSNNRLERRWTELSPNWAGVVRNEPTGSITTIVGDFTVPAITGKIGDGISVWVGIDGNTCYGGLLQAGIDCIIANDGTTAYSAWYEWWPQNSTSYQGDFAVSAGDFIKVNVTAYPPNSGIAIVENQTRNQMVSQTVTGDPAYPLCQQDAEWIVEDFMSNSTYDAFANFDPVVFTHARATGDNGTFSPDNGQLIDLQKNGQVLTSVTYDSTSLTISHV